MQKLTGFTIVDDPSDDIPSVTLEKYAERTLAKNVFDVEAFQRMLWAGRLDLNDSGYVPPLVPWRKRVFRAVRYWLYDNLPRIHRGPCDHDDCY